MNNFGKYIKPEDAKKFGDATGDLHQIGYWRNLANQRPRKCEVCETEDQWKYGRCGMCFSCTTGEADAGDDMELEP